jgi:hypothetical protein
MIGQGPNAQHLMQPARGYVTGQALTHLTVAVKAGKAGDLVPAEVDRFFMTRVTPITGRNAIVALRGHQHRNPSRLHVHDVVGDPSSARCTWCYRGHQAAR